MSIRRAFPVMSIAFCAVYALCLAFKWKLFIYYPVPREVHRHLDPSLGPPMFYYGWLVSGILGGLVVGGIYLLFPPREHKSLQWLLWVAPILAMGVTIFMNRNWFF